MYYGAIAVKCQGASHGAQRRSGTFESPRGDRVAFCEEHNQVILTKARVVALQDLKEAIRKEAAVQGLTEEAPLRALEHLREERWHDRQS